jgi:hypothetical protein
MPMKQERVMFDKITSRISKQCYGLNKQFVDPATVALKCFKVRAFTSAMATLQGS